MCKGVALKPKPELFWFLVQNPQENIFPLFFSIGNLSAGRNKKARILANEVMECKFGKVYGFFKNAHCHISDVALFIFS
jgi:hypothetical protein